MSTKSRNYLYNIESKLDLATSSKKEILHELQTHFEERIQELKEAGFSDEEAIKTTAEHFGSTFRWWGRAVVGDVDAPVSVNNGAEFIVREYIHQRNP